jgi:hypothetical protein
VSHTFKERTCDRCMKRRRRDARGRFLKARPHSCLMYRIVRADFYAQLAVLSTCPWPKAYRWRFL